MDEVFIVSSIIDKLSPFWRDIRHALKNKREEIILFDLGRHIVFESSIRIQENQKDEDPNADTINMVVEGKPSHFGEKKKRKIHLSRRRLLVLTLVKRYIGNVASPGTKEKLFCFQEQVKEGKGWLSFYKQGPSYSR